MRLKPKSKIVELRDKAGLTQAQLAVLVGVTTNTIQNWEKENGLNQLERYLKLAEILGCDVSELIEYIPVSDEEIPKTKGFSLQELRELRERWGLDNTSDTESSKNSNKSLGV